MNDTAARIPKVEAQTTVGTRHGVLDRCLRSLVLGRLGGMYRGRLRVIDGATQTVFGQMDCDGPEAVVEIRDPRFYRSLFWSGTLGAAEAFIRGWWTSPKLLDVIRFFCRNLDRVEADRGWARLGIWAARLRHVLRPNSLRGSRRNIAAHYDLGNEFFATFLDETLAYSCAVFSQVGEDLAAASRRKFDLICGKLDLQPSDHLLEIGTGWGGFALHAARNYGCRVTTTTISSAQYRFACDLVERSGAADRVKVLDRDYRELQGRFDKLVSIEMIEAVGREHLDRFFAECSQRLQSDGLMLLQAILMPDQRYRQYCRSTDFIQHYVFPGGHLPSLGAICDSVGRVTDLHIVSMDDLTAHYAETLARWHENLLGNRDRVRAMGFDEEFLRLWEYYLCYCQAGFRERVIRCAQILLAKPRRAAAIGGLPRSEATALSQQLECSL